MSAAMAPAYALSGLVASCSAALPLEGGDWSPLAGSPAMAENGGPRGWSSASPTGTFTGGRGAWGADADEEGYFFSYANGTSTTSGVVAADTVLRVVYGFTVPASVTQVQVAAPVELGYGSGGGGTERQTVSLQIQDGSTLLGAPVKVALRRFDPVQVVSVPAYSAVASLKRSEEVVAADHTLVTHSSPTLLGTTVRTVYTSVTPLTGAGERTVSVVYTLTLDGQLSAWAQDDVILRPPAMYPCALTAA